MNDGKDTGLDGWAEDYENESVKFLIYDSQSGSRWLDHNYIKSFIDRLLDQRGREERERITRLIKTAEVHPNAREYIEQVKAGRDAPFDGGFDYGTRATRAAIIARLNDPEI